MICILCVVPSERSRGTQISTVNADYRFNTGCVVVEFAYLHIHDTGHRAFHLDAARRPQCVHVQVVILCLCMLYFFLARRSPMLCPLSAARAGPELHSVC